MTLLRLSDIQLLLAKAGYYKGAIDGIFGNLTRTAVYTLLSKHKDIVNPSVLKTSAGEHRMAVAAGQLILRFASYSVGEIDGYAGNQTIGAFLEWKHWDTYGKPLILSKEPIRAQGPESEFPSQKDCPDFYGPPASAALEAQLTLLHVPFPLRLDYNLGVRTDRIRIHEKCAESLYNILAWTYESYGMNRIQALGLDRFAGSYVPRKMRGSDSWSMHAYGCATDWYAGPNGLTTRCPEATFCDLVYSEWIDIWESHGWVSLGREIGRDWMHFQAATLN